MHVRTKLNAVLDDLDNVALLRVYDLAKAYQLSGQLQTRKPETTKNRSVQLNNYLQAQEALAEVKGELSDLIIEMREDRI